MSNFPFLKITLNFVQHSMKIQHLCMKNELIERVCNFIALKLSIANTYNYTQQLSPYFQVPFVTFVKYIDIFIIIGAK